MIERMYTIKETAEVLRKSPKTVRRYVLSGLLPALRSGPKTYVISESELKKFMHVGISDDERVKQLVNKRMSLRSI